MCLFTPAGPFNQHVCGVHTFGIYTVYYKQLLEDPGSYITQLLLKLEEDKTKRCLMAARKDPVSRIPSMPFTCPVVCQLWLLFTLTSAQVRVTSVATSPWAWYTQRSYYRCQILVLIFSVLTTGCCQHQRRNQPDATGHKLRICWQCHTEDPVARLLLHVEGEEWIECLVYI